MKFNIKKFKKNILFFCISVLIIVIVLVLSFISGEENIITEELSDKDINISGLVINEIMTSNKGTIVDKDGKLCDYVEIYNGTDEDINLNGYGLSDSATEIKYTFGDVVIKSKGYHIVFLSGTLDENHAPFKLKSGGGEQVGLFKRNGKAIDAIKTVSLDSSTVMARNADGEWVIMNNPTPGFSNNKEGHNEFIESLKTTSENKTLVINEILVNNKGNFKTLDYGEYSGYVEIKNISSETINLFNYSLSNSTDSLYKWQFPDINISSGEVLVIFTSNRDSYDKELHASFKLKNTNGTVVLSGCDGSIIDMYDYENVPSGMALVRTNDSLVLSSTISPGESNDKNGVDSFMKKYLETPMDLIINEVMSNNYQYLPQNQGEYYDYIELYNNSSKEINLSDYCLTTNSDVMCKYKLPDAKLGSGEYYIVMASGDENLSNSSYNHTNFKISDNESLYVTKGSKIIDSMFASSIPNGYSFGRNGKYGLYYFSSPTPGSANSNGESALSYKVSASVPSGIYNDVLNVSVSLSGGETIYYTLDGSTPGYWSNVYSSPLELSETTVLKTISSSGGMLNSEVSTYTYIINANHKIDVMSISIDNDKLKRINNNPWNESVIEKCHVEYLPLNKEGFSIDGGLKLFGGSTRGHSKKSYEVKFKKQYGEGKLHYQMFDSVDSSVFDSLVFRTGSQDEMGSASKKALIRDIVGTSLVKKYTSVDVQAYKPVALYINGSYWGLYFVREKIDETLVANHYNVPSSKTDTDLLRIDGQVKSGTNEKYNSLINFVTKNSLSNESNYEAVKELIDIENLCDFWIAEAWTTNNDIVNVRFFSNKNVDNGKWKFILYDLDYAFYNVNVNYFNFSTNSSGMTVSGYSTVLLRNLMKSDEFKKTYLERLSYNLNNTWNEENVINMIDSVISEISTDEINRNLERWGSSYSSFEKNIEFLKDYARNRRSYIVSQAKSYFKLSSEQMSEYFGE